MEAIYLQSMTDFVIRKYKDELVHSGEKWRDFLEKYARITKSYADFLKQPLQLGFFVPCDENGNVLEEPYFDGENDHYYSAKKEEFEKAKERVLFKYFKVVEYSDNTIEIVSDTAPNFIIPFKKLSNKDWEQRYNHIEDLLKSIIKIQLTETAIKQIGL